MLQQVNIAEVSIEAWKLFIEHLNKAAQLRIIYWSPDEHPESYFEFCMSPEYDKTINPKEVSDVGLIVKFLKSNEVAITLNFLPEPYRDRFPGYTRSVNAILCTNPKLTTRTYDGWSNGYRILLSFAQAIQADYVLSLLPPEPTLAS